MRAAVCRQFGAPLEIETISIAEPGADDVRVNLRACAICHSDIIYADGLWGDPLPAVYGHEAAGIVESVGSNVENITAGDHVVVTLIRSCGYCSTCENVGHASCDATFNLYDNPPLHDANGAEIFQAMATGAFAEQVVVHSRQVCRIPREISLDTASLLACGVITGFGAVTNTAKVEPGRSVAVIGCGGVGINAVQGAVYAKASPIIAVDIVDEKLRLAATLGADHVVDGSTNDVVTSVLDLTESKGADYVIITSSASSAFAQAQKMLAPGGTLVVVAMPGSEVFAQYHPDTLASRSQKFIGSKMGSTVVERDIPKLVELYQRGQLKLDELISGRYALDEINEAIAASRGGSALRNVILFE